VRALLRCGLLFRFALRDLPISLGNSEILGWVMYAVYFVTFPTQILFLDAEDLGAILFLLVMVAPVNGAWYVLVAASFLFFRDALQSLRRWARRGHPLNGDT
jgi:hypothetical protein